MANEVQNHRHSVNIIEQCRVSPPPCSVPSTSLPLTFFDLPWFHCHPVQRIFFYEFPHPTHHFLQHVLPTLKHSLSLTLQHFFSLASNLVLPPQPNIPYILYSQGDSISFTVAESTQDFHHLIAPNTPRDVTDLHPFVPELPSPRTLQDGTMLIPLMAIQVTVLSSYGFSICITFRHVAADGRAFHQFMKFWAYACRTRGDLASLEGSLTLPCYNRDIIDDPKGLKLMYLEELWNSSQESKEFMGYIRDELTERFRYTFVLSSHQVEKLKKWVCFQCKCYDLERESLHISTFVVICSLTWVCKVKSEEGQHNDVNNVPNNDEIYKFAFLADCRNSTEFSIPSTYFGNCLVGRVVSLEKSKLIGENGIVEAAIAIESKVRDFQREALKGIETFMSMAKELAKPGQHVVTIAGSPKLGVYESDFGWGKPNMSEILHIEYSGSVFLSDCRDNEGGVEVGLALEKNQTNSFIIIMEEHLRNILDYP